MADDFAARVGPLARRMREEGQSLRTIAARLTAMGVRTARGGDWAAVAGTPEPLLARMGGVVSRALAEPEVRARIEERGADVVASSAEECAAFLAGEIERWGRVVRDNDIRGDFSAAPSDATPSNREGSPVAR